ncbi:hypothetical protein GCM10007941_02230 [Amphritea balenae]|nr:hypothetical protein GCM10007941_02230 [Amphritea balenae]
MEWFKLVTRQQRDITRVVTVNNRQAQKHQSTNMVFSNNHGTLPDGGIFRRYDKKSPGPALQQIQAEASDLTQ